MIAPAAAVSGPATSANLGPGFDSLGLALTWFDEVTAEHARAEGEGDRSLAHWRAMHERFFREHADHDRQFSPTMPVVLERFEVLVPVELRPDQPRFFGRG